MHTLRSDPFAPLVMALESFDETTQTAVPATMLTQRTLIARTPVLGVENPDDALAVCVEANGRVDLQEIASLSPMSSISRTSRQLPLRAADPCHQARRLACAGTSSCLTAPGICRRAKPSREALAHRRSLASVTSRPGSTSALDHVSIAAPFAELQRLGFALTVSDSSDGRHARVLLDRMYLEVTATDDARPPRGRGWFVRPDDLVAAAADLRRRDVAATGPAPYIGHDGSWLDIKIELPGVETVLPVLTRRQDAGDWPPPLSAPHPNGARSISELHLRTGAPEALAFILGLLGAQQDAHDRLVLPGGALIVLGPAAGGPEGVARVVISCDAAPVLTIDLVQR